MNLQIQNRFSQILASKEFLTEYLRRWFFDYRKKAYLKNKVIVENAIFKIYIDNAESEYVQINTS